MAAIMDNTADTTGEPIVSSMGVLAIDLATRSGWSTNINRTSGVRISDVKRGDPWADPPQKLLNMRQPLSTSPTTE